MKLFSEETLAHYGIQGQKWGERRWQNQDGTFNEEGKERYFRKINDKINKAQSKVDEANKKYEYHEAKVRKHNSRLIKIKYPGSELLNLYHKWRSDRNFVKMEKNKRIIEKLEKKLEKGRNKVNELFSSNDEKMTIFDAYKFDRENNKNLSDEEFDKKVSKTFNDLFDVYLKTPINFKGNKDDKSKK